MSYTKKCTFKTLAVTVSMTFSTEYCSYNDLDGKTVSSVQYMKNKIFTVTWMMYTRLVKVSSIQLELTSSASASLEATL